METTLTVFPDQTVLAVHLTKMLTADGVTAGPVTVIDRCRNIYSSTFPSEVVTCRFSDGSQRQLLCKYQTSQKDSFGSRGDIAYEARVYRDVLQSQRYFAPEFIGICNTENSGHFLVLEFLRDAVRLDQSEDPEVLIKAARRIGEFHASHETQLGDSSYDLLQWYDLEYYQGWVERAFRFAGSLRQDFPWFSALCKEFEACLPALFNFPVTLIHGEFYPHNILIQEGRIRIVDWQTAAIALGEIDLASLTDRWSFEITEQCVLEYRRARWPKGTPEDCERAWLLACLYLQFRWLGDRKEWTRLDSNLWRFEALRSAGERLGLI